jgi:translation initiation factor 4E
VLAAIGGQFSSDLCGLVVSVRGSEDIIHVWNRSNSNAKNNFSIRDTIKECLELPVDASLEYKAHVLALKLKKPENK